MNIVMRGIATAFLVGSSIVLVGCSTDNETEAEKLQGKLGGAPKSEVKSSGPVEGAPGSMDAYVKRQQDQQSADKKSSEYGKAAQGGK